MATVYLTKHFMTIEKKEKKRAQMATRLFTQKANLPDAILTTLFAHFVAWVNNDASVYWAGRDATLRSLTKSAGNKSAGNKSAGNKSAGNWYRHTRKMPRGVCTACPMNRKRSQNQTHRTIQNVSFSFTDRVGLKCIFLMQTLGNLTHISNLRIQPWRLELSS